MSDSAERRARLRLAIEVLEVVSLDTLGFAEEILRKLAVPCPEIEAIRRAHTAAIARKDESHRPFAEERNRLVAELRKRLATLLG